MLIVIPISSSDAELSPYFVGAIRSCHPHLNHKFLIVSRPSDADLANKLHEQIGTAAVPGGISVHCFEQDGPKGWPLGPNFYWSETVRLLQNKNNLLPWLWMELDCTPLVPGWADKLEEEYKNCGTPFLGMYGYRSLISSTGHETRQKHLVGVAVYPPQVTEYSTLWSGVSNTETAFDVVCENEFVPKSTESKIMQHGFRTSNYMIGQENIIKGFPTSVYQLDFTYDKPIQEGVVLHHGCEDGSLAKLVAQRTNLHFNFYGPRSFIPV